MNADDTIEKSEGFMVDSSGGPVQVTLPATAAIGDTVRIADIAGSFQTNNCTISRNGHNIMGLAHDLTLDKQYTSIGLLYTNATYGWILTEIA